MDQYPLPQLSDLFTCLTGGTKFTKLDLSAAYQQLSLDAESRKLVTINFAQHRHMEMLMVCHVSQCKRTSRVRLTMLWCSTLLPVCSSELMAATCTDPQLSKILQYVRKGWPEKILDTLRPFWQRRSELTVEGDSVLWGVCVVIPTKLRHRVLEELHRGHPGVVRMKALARSHVWWPELDRDVEN